MENEYIKEIERLQTCLDKAHKLINSNRLERSRPGDFLLQLESYVEEAGEKSKMVRKWETNYIVERDNAEALRAELDKYKKTIDDHNQEMLDLCLNNKNCDPVYYGPHRGECPECTRTWMVRPPSNKTPAGDD